MYKYAHCILDTQEGCAYLSLQMLANIKYEHDECAPVNQRNGKICKSCTHCSYHRNRFTS